MHKLLASMMAVCVAMSCCNCKDDAKTSESQTAKTDADSDEYSDERRAVNWLGEVSFSEADSPHVAFSTSSYKDYKVWIENGRKIPNLATILTGFLREKSNKVDLPKVAYALGWLGDAQCVPDLIACLASSDMYLRIEAAASLGRLGDARSIDALCTALLSDDASNVRANAAEALGHFSGEKVETCLERALADHSGYVKEMAKASLQKVSSDR